MDGLVETVFKKYTSMEDKERELAFLGRLQPYNGFPKIVRENPTGFYLNNCGIDIKQALANKWVSTAVLMANFTGLLRILSDLGIRHRDLRYQNMLWHPERGAHIIDFGTAIWHWEEPENKCPPDCWPNEWFMKLSDLEQLTLTLKELATEKVIKKEEWYGYSFS